MKHRRAKKVRRKGCCIADNNHHNHIPISSEESRWQCLVQAVVLHLPPQLPDTVVLLCAGTGNCWRVLPVVQQKKPVETLLHPGPRSSAVPVLLKALPPRLEGGSVFRPLVFDNKRLVQMWVNNGSGSMRNTLYQIRRKEPLRALVRFQSGATDFQCERERQRWIG